MQKTIDVSSLFVTDASGKMPYRSRKGEQRTAISWGQRKLIIGEIEFFLYFWNPKTLPTPTVVYVGASPGSHIPLLASMFESVAAWHLYDPRPFKIQGTSKIHLHQQLFTDKDAKSWAGRDDVIFISDIRTADHTTMKSDEVEAAVWSDNVNQSNWVKLMNPAISSLKFRLPYSDVWAEMLKAGKLGSDVTAQTVKYLKGLIMFQAWQPASSSESRLIVTRDDGLAEITYDLIDYEQVMAYHNNVTREQEKYKSPIGQTDDELGSDFDSTLEAYVLKLYFYKMLGSDETAGSTILKLSRLITDELNLNRPSKVNLSILRTAEHGSARAVTRL